MPSLQAENIVHFRFGWPVGMKLRLRRASHLLVDYAYLGGCPVIVTGDAFGMTHSSLSRQFVYLLEGRDERFSTERVRPRDLELIPDIDPEAGVINQRIVDDLPGWWIRTFKPRCTRHFGTSARQSGQASSC